MTWIRTAVKAVIVRDGRLLLNHCRGAGGEYYALPGGGQQVGETLDAALVRECREEIGVTVQVGPLRWVRDHVVAHHADSYVTEAPHQLEHLFVCTLEPGAEPCMGASPDAEQLGVAWLGPDALARVRLKPSWFGEVLRVSETLDASPVYQGDRD